MVIQFLKKDLVLCSFHEINKMNASFCGPVFTQHIPVRDALTNVQRHFEIHMLYRHRWHIPSHYAFKKGVHGTGLVHVWPLKDYYDTPGSSHLGGSL